MNLFYSFFLIIYSVSCCFMGEFSDDKFEALLTFYDFYFYLIITNHFLLTEIEWCFEMFYFFLLEVNFVNRILIFSTVVCI